MEFFFVILTIGFILLIIGSLIGYADIINNDKNFGCSKFLFIKLYFLVYFFDFSKNSNYQYRTIVRILYLISMILIIIGLIGHNFFDNN